MTGFCAEPSEFITQMFTTKFVFSVSLPSRARAEVNAILVPSFSQGNAIWSGLPPPPTTAPGPIAVRLVRCVGDEPSAFMTQMFVVLFVLAVSVPSRARVETKAILLPSGEMEGSALSVVVKLVNGVGLRGKTAVSSVQMLGIPKASPTRAALMP